MSYCPFIFFKETEIDFGSTIPVSQKRFTVVDNEITSNSKVVVLPSGNIATGRVGNDWEWDTIQFAAKSGNGSFDLTAYASGRIKGKRKIYYIVQY